MGKLLRRLGRMFIILTKQEQDDIRPSVLVIDSDRVSQDDFTRITVETGERFKNAKLLVVVFGNKEESIRKYAFGAELLILKRELPFISLRLIKALFLSMRKRPAYTVLSSLEPIPVAMSLLVSRSRVFLHNRWFEWYRLRLRTVLDILRCKKSADHHQATYSIFRKLSRVLGRWLVVVDNFKEEDILTPLLVVDNGYTDDGHIITAVRRAEKALINPVISVLSFAERERCLRDVFPSLKLIIPEKQEAYKPGVQMRRLRNERFDYVLLTALDIHPIFVAMTRGKVRVLLYNKWHQWWSLDFLRIKGCLIGLWRFLAIVPIFIFLLVSVGCSLFLTAVRSIFATVGYLIDKIYRGRDG